MLTQPCAKINLGLYVTERRPDGYHNLQTIFYPIPLTDELEVVPAHSDSLDIEGIPVAGRTEDNLVMKVVSLLRNEGYRVPPVSIRLKKNIPSGAGLGGGSSDAAYMMRMLNEMFQLGMSIQEMEQKVARLGADCAFFIQSRPMFAEGIGNVFTPISLPRLKGRYLVLVKPDDFVSTKEAYAHVSPKKPNVPLMTVIGGDIDKWKKSVKNDFETSVFPTHPTIAEIKESLYASGADYAAMSGSGSSVFGIFSAPVKIETPHFLFTTQL